MAEQHILQFLDVPLPAHFLMSTATETSALAGALGSMIGYLGSEAAEPFLFERLLWPQRFYNRNTIAGALKAMFLMPMGGPLHRAALETLDGFRRKGLYGGIRHGHMLGTAFYADTKLKYKVYGHDTGNEDNEVRNGLWVVVMRRLRAYQSNYIDTPVEKHDTEKLGQEAIVVRRTSQRVQHLKLSRPGAAPDVAEVNVQEFSDHHIGLGVFASIFASEVTTLACVIVIIWVERCYWFAGYLCVPLFLKLLAPPCSVRREPIAPASGSVLKPTKTNPILIEVSDYDYGFPLVEGPEDVVLQFFRHWGHPIRKNHRDRAREVFGMGVVFAFVIYFPVGLLSMLWVSQNAQIVWLSYQMYVIAVMHINRLSGFDGSGLMEDNIAQALSQNKTVRLRSCEDLAVEARLESYVVARIAHGQELVKRIADKSLLSRDLIRTESDESMATTVGGDSEVAFKTLAASI